MGLVFNRKKKQIKGENKIKIAFFVEHLEEKRDGAVRTVFQIIKRIPKDKFDVIFFTAEEKPTDFGFEVFKLTSFSTFFNKSYKFGSAELTFGLKKKLNEFKPDVIHITSPSPMGVFASKYAVKNNIPFTTIYHTNYHTYADYYLKNFPFGSYLAKKFVITPWTKSVFNFAKRSYIPTASMIRDLSLYGIRSDNMVIWGRGIDSKLFNPKKRTESLREDWGNGFKFILFASRLVWEKELKTLVKVYKLFEKKHKDVKFVIVGDGPQKNDLIKLMPNAIFLGMLSHEDLSRVYASSDIFIFPSVSETYGNVVVEAMASGLPCVVAGSGGSMDHIVHGVNGFHSIPRDSRDMYYRTLDILNSPKLSNTLSKKALRYTKNLSWESLTKRLFSDWVVFGRGGL